MLNYAASAFSNAHRVVLPTELHPISAPRGLMAGTRIETAHGWKPVQDLVPGDLVHTRDGGLRPLARIDRQSFAGPRGPEGLRGVLLVPGGALMNCTPFYLLPEQHLMLETEYAEAILGTPQTLVPGRALEGFRGITQVRIKGKSEVFVLRFSEEETVWCNTGILAHCPSIREAETPSFRSEFFTVLTDSQAEALLGLMEIGAVDSSELGRADDL